MEPVIASYTVEITVRGDEGVPPTNKEIEDAIESALVDLGNGTISVRAVSERTDK